MPPEVNSYVGQVGEPRFSQLFIPAHRCLFTSFVPGVHASNQLQQQRSSSEPRDSVVQPREQEADLHAVCSRNTGNQQHVRKFP